MSDWRNIPEHEKLSDEERTHEYRICRRRGHQTSGEGYSHGNGADWSICRWCGTHYRIAVRQELIEQERTKPPGARF